MGDSTGTSYTCIADTMEQLPIVEFVYKDIRRTCVCLSDHCIRTLHVNELPSHFRNLCLTFRFKRLLPYTFGHGIV